MYMCGLCCIFWVYSVEQSGNMCYLLNNYLENYVPAYFLKFETEKLKIKIKNICTCY